MEIHHQSWVAHGGPLLEEGAQGLTFPDVGEDTHSGCHVLQEHASWHHCTVPPFMEKKRSALCSIDWMVLKSTANNYVGLNYIKINVCSMALSASEWL